MTVEEINEMSKTQLKETLDEEEIEYPAKATVAALRKIAVEHLVDDEDEDEDDEEETEEEDDDLELEELDDAEEEAPKPKSTKKKAAAKKKAPKIEFGAKQLAEYISGEIGKNYDARQLRVLLRKMAKDGRIARDPEADARSRYSWAGPKDPEVKEILKAVKGGEIEKSAKESLDALKESKAKKKADAPAPKKGKKTRKAPEPEPEDDDEELDEDELEDLD